MKSLSNAGPRRPAFSELWLSASGTPWFVVIACPPLSARTRGSSPPAALTPGLAAPPVLADEFFSDRLLALALGTAGSTVSPAGGVAADLPYSARFEAL